MKLIVENPSGTRFTFEGEALELAEIATKLAGVHLEPGPGYVPQKLDPIPGIWTESNLRELRALLWGDQAKLMEFLLDRSGEAPYSEIGVHMGFTRQKLGAILSAIMRNGRKAANDPEAQLLRWKLSDSRGQIIYIDPAAQPILQDIRTNPSL
jgi:hypothetical protein